MLKALLKKQLLELGAYYFRNSRKKNRSSGAGRIVLFVLLFILIFISLGSMFFFISMTLCEPLIAMGLEWLYFAIIGLIATALGIFGSVFNTYAGLYHAKDNDLLLSMPIPPSKILLVRLLGVYLMGLLFEAVVMVPAVIARWIAAPTSALQVVLQILLILLLGLVILILTCALGWVVALIAGKLKNKSFMTVLLSLVFIAVYYFVYFRINTFLQGMLAHADSVAESIRGMVYPAYIFGRAGTGDLVSFLIFTACALVLFALCIFIMSRTFLRIVTDKPGVSKAAYKDQPLKTSSTRSALLRRELRHFLASPTYMLNSGLGTLLLPILAVYALIKMGTVRTFLTQVSSEIPGIMAFLPLVAIAAVGLLSTMNTITAPSVSLEGRSMWVIRSLPVDVWEVLKAKLKLHIFLTMPPTLLAAVVLGIVIRAGWLQGACMVVTAILFVLLTALMGLSLNLKKPNLNWTNETVAVKQSPAVLITIFGLWAVAVAMGALYYPLRGVMKPEPYMLLWILLLAAADVLLTLWLRRRGTKIFEEL